MKFDDALEINSALAIYAHPDDNEWNSGGTIASWVRQGVEVNLVLVTNGASGSPTGSRGRRFSRSRTSPPTSSSATCFFSAWWRERTDCMDGDSDIPLCPLSLLMMEVVEQAYNDCACYDEQARDPLDAAKLVEGRTEVTVARRILVTMTTQTLSHNKDIIHFALRMQFITDITSTAFTTVLINEV